jgi:transcriptional antiterminator NusG
MLMYQDLRLDQWYCVFVVTGSEDKARERIKYRLQNGFTVVVPKRKLRVRRGGVWRTEKRPLLPGYVLINGEIDTDTYYRLKNIPDVLRLLKTGAQPARINPDEMAILSKLMCNSEEIGFSEILVENGIVRVIDGPLFSLEGIIKSIDHRKQRAKVILNFLGEERTVDLGISILKPV